MKLVVVGQRPFAFGHFGALGLEEPLPEPLRFGLLAIDAFALVPVALDGPRVDVGPLRAVDVRLFEVDHSDGGGWCRLSLERSDLGSDTLAY